MKEQNAASAKNTLINNLSQELLGAIQEGYKMKVKIHENIRAGAEIIFFDDNIILIIKDGECLVLGQDRTNVSGLNWGAICTCGCSRYPKEKLDNFAEKHNVRLLFESSAFRSKVFEGTYGHFSLMELVENFFPEHTPYTFLRSINFDHDLAIEEVAICEKAVQRDIIKSLPDILKSRCNN